MIGGWSQMNQGPRPSSKIHTLSPDTNDWVPVGNFPIKLESSVVMVLPESDILVVIVGAMTGSDLSDKV